MSNKNCQDEIQKKSLLTNQLPLYILRFFCRAASYGLWVSPTERTIVEFSEGDLTTTVCESDAELVAELRALARWADEAGYGPTKIQALFPDELRRAFERLGVADLLH